MQDINPLSALLPFVIIVLVIIGLFFLFRSILLWYWKIDKIVENQQRLNSLVAKQKDVLNDILDELKNKTKEEQKP